MKRRVLNLLIALDQFVYVLLTFGHGSPDETLSAAAWRWEQAGKWHGKLLRPLIDALARPWGRNHCWHAFDAERRKAHLPPEYRSSFGVTNANR